MWKVSGGGLRTLQIIPYVAETFALWGLSCVTPETLLAHQYERLSVDRWVGLGWAGLGLLGDVSRGGLKLAQTSRKMNNCRVCKASIPM